MSQHFVVIIITMEVNGHQKYLCVCVMQKKVSNAGL